MASLAESSLISSITFFVVGLSPLLLLLIALLLEVCDQLECVNGVVALAVVVLLLPDALLRVFFRYTRVPLIAIPVPRELLDRAR